MAESQTKNSCSFDMSSYELGEFALGAGLLTVMFIIAYEWTIPLALMIGGFGLMVHELGHKYVGKIRCVDNVNFVISPLGVGVGIATSAIIGHTLTSPGGVTVGNNSSERDRLYMAIAGPATNLLVFGVFYGVHILNPINIAVGATQIPLFLSIALINLYLGFFNLLPVPLFDGSWIYKYDRLVWAGVFSFSAILVYFTWGGFMDTLFPLFTMSRGGILGHITGNLPVMPGLLVMSSTEVSVSNYVMHSVVDKRKTNLIRS